MQHRLTFGSWKLPEGNTPAADHARVWASLNMAYKLPPSQGQQPGGASMSSPENLDAAIELMRMFRATQESDSKNYLAFAGASFILGTPALELLKGNWKALRNFLGADGVEDIVMVESFFKNVEEFDPNEKKEDTTAAPPEAKGE